MIISHSKSFIFIHIQKTGGTSIELALEPILIWSDIILGSTHFGESINGPYRARFGLSKHSPLSVIERVCGERLCREYYSFATVRHPVARLCSLYNYVGSKVHDWAARQRIPAEEAAAHITEESRTRTPALKWPATRAFLATTCFSEFIRSTELATEPAFRSQASCLRSRADGAIHVDAFRLEDKVTWASRLRARLGVEFTLPHSNKSRLTLMAAATVGVEDRRFVETRFAEDYAAFGY